MNSGIYIVRKIAEIRKPKEERLIQNLRILRKTQYWPKDKIIRYQHEKLKVLMNHAYNNVPFYHQRFKMANLKPDDINQSSDLSQITPLTKIDIQKNLDKLLCKKMKERAILYRTGGSTGEPLQFYVEKKMKIQASAAVHRGWEWGGFNIGDRCALLWGSSFDLENTHSRNSSKFKKLIFPNRVYNAFDLSNESMRAYSIDMKTFKPKVIRAYASAITTFAKFVKDNDIKGIQPKSIITTAENLYPHQRKLIEEVFTCNVFDSYGSRETSLIAHECEVRDGYHVSDENSIVEYLDKNGEPVAPGESGEIVITDLHNMVMPWIRYKIGDLGTPTDEICSCGRTLSIMKSIDGRIHDMFVTPDGRRVPGEFFPHLFKDVDSILEYRLIQKSMNKIVVEIVKSQKFKDSDIQYLLKHMSNYLGDEVNIEFVYLDKIDWPESGKRRFTVSEVVE